MKTLATVGTIAGVIVAGFLAGCATSGGGSPEQLACLQPNWRVAVEITGTVIKPAPKPKPGAKPGKPGTAPAEFKALVQGNSAFDFKSAVLKDGGKGELDNLVKKVASSKLPFTTNAVIITGHSDRLESGDNVLSESRAKAVTDYLVSKGVDSKLIFWEGKGSQEPVPVTKFCES